MEQQFKKWLIQRGYSETGAAISYSRAINQISEHYSKNTGQQIDIYTISEQEIVSKIAHDYGQTGRFSDFGNKQHGRYRAAIYRYSEFFVNRNEQLNSDNNDQHIEEVIQTQKTELQQNNFAYERDLQTTLCAQISELFPGYKIYGESNLGIEYSIGGRRIDILLENIETGDLLAIELKSGKADFKVFGQISMYIGLLQKKFPNKNITGVIVAGIINDSLRQACEITDKVQLKIYRMSIELENA